MTRFTFKGMMAPNFTPLKDDGSLNLDLIPVYAKHLRDCGVTGVWVSGTSGEGMSLTMNERKAVAEAWLSCKTLLPSIIVHCGAGCLKDTQELAQHAEHHGAPGVAVLPCLFDKPKNTDELVDYMEEVAKACPKTPLFYYHIPMKTEVNLSMSEFLAKGVKRIPTLSGLKFTDKDVSGEGRECLKVDGGTLTIFSGFDETLQDALSVGFTASVNVSFNFLPHLGAKVFSLMKEGKEEEAKKAQKEITDCFQILFKSTGGFTVANVKTASTLLTGLNLGPTRLPVKPLTPPAISTLKNDLKNLGYKVY